MIPENCMHGLSGGRRSAREQSSAPPPTRHRRNLEQSRSIGGGECGGKAAGRREGEQQRMLRTQCRVQHVTEAVSLRVLRVWAAKPKGTGTFDLRQEPGAGCVKKTSNRHAVREVKEGPSGPPCRGRPQAATSCFCQKLR